MMIVYRLMRNTTLKFGLYGAGLHLSYELIYYYLRHHDESTARPAFFDHTLSTTLISTATAALVFPNPMHWAITAFFGLTIFSPVSWWLGRRARFAPTRNPNIFYLNDTTKEEIERFQM